MSCPFFNCKYGIGICNASENIHVPGIDEMGLHCFKDSYNSCSIFRDHKADADPPRDGGDVKRSANCPAVRM